jgi:hypothetical protein
VYGPQVRSASPAHPPSWLQTSWRFSRLARVRAESRAAEERKRRLLVAGLAASLLALAVLIGGGGLWLAWQRAARLESADQVATVALREASLLLGRARAASEGPLTPWVEAVAWLLACHLPFVQAG